MPLVYGTIYPEVSPTGMYSNHLHILVKIGEDQRLVTRTIEKLSVLREYLRGLENSSLSLTIYIADPEIPQWLEVYALSTTGVEEGGTVDCEAMCSMAESIDADFIAVESKTTEDNTRLADMASCPVVDYSEVLRQSEIFSRGHEVPWSSDQPVWYMPWSSFYSMLDELCKWGYVLYQRRARFLNISEETLESIRSLLLNRLSKVCYSRDKLQFICQQRDYAKRHGWAAQAFVFEAGYFLSHYYYLLSGGTEQLARIVASCLSLNVSNRIQVSLGNPKFIGKIIAGNSEVGEIFKKTWFTDWIGKLKTLRDHIAHEGTVLLSPLATEPDTMMTDEELDSAVRRMPEYLSVLSVIPPDQQPEHVAMLKENLRVSQFKVQRDDALIIAGTDGQIVLFPLDDIEWHFDNYRRLLMETLSVLFKVLEEQNG